MQALLCFLTINELMFSKLVTINQNVTFLLKKKQNVFFFIVIKFKILVLCTIKISIPISKERLVYAVFHLKRNKKINDFHVAICTCILYAYSFNNKHLIA